MMRILNISLDKTVFETGSLAQKRLTALAEKAGEMVVFVPGERDETRSLSSHLVAYSVAGWKVVQFCKLYRRAREMLARAKFDAVTVQDTSYLAFLAFVLARKAGIPFEVQVHGLEKFYGIRKMIAGFVLRRADKIRVVSERLRRLLVSCFSLSVSRIYVLPVYAQTEGQIFEKKEPSTFTFLTVGRLVAVKNIGLQIRAFARIAEKFPQTRLVIVGDGPLWESLGSEVKSLRLDGRVLLEGRQEDLRRYYQGADAFLLTSDFEGYGIAVIEAAAYELPIIMTDVGLAGEFVKNGENGIVVPVGDEEALLNSMRKLFLDGELRKRLGKEARRLFLTLPSREEYIVRQAEEWGK